MRKLFTPLSFIALLILLTAGNCKKEKNKTPIDQLPPETQTGANTFGCLVNGEVFKPGGAQLSGGSLNAIYQYLIPGTQSGYTFAISAINTGNNCFQKQIGFAFDSIAMSIGIYALKKRMNGQGGGVPRISLWPVIY